MQSKTHRDWLVRVVAIVAWLFSVSANAQQQDRFLDDEQNLSPVSLLFALEPVAGTPVQGFRFDLRGASQSIRDSAPDSNVLLDGETAVASIIYTHQLGPRAAVSAYVPYIWHSGGTLDGFIDDWHSWFGLPDGIRNNVARDQLDFRLQQNGTDVFNLERNAHGLGDIRLRAHWSPKNPDSDHWSLAVAVKLPTGDSDKLTGSGSSDVSLTLNWRQQPEAEQKWSLGAAAGAVYLGKSDIAFTDQARATWLAQATGTYQATQRLTLGARLQLHGEVLDNVPDDISGPSVMLVTGVSYAFNDDWQLQVTVAEDVKVDSAPDVIFRVGLSHRTR